MAVHERHAALQPRPKGLAAVGIQGCRLHPGSARAGVLRACRAQLREAQLTLILTVKLHLIQPASRISRLNPAWALQVGWPANLLTSSFRQDGSRFDWLWVGWTCLLDMNAHLRQDGVFQCATATGLSQSSVVEGASYMKSGLYRMLCLHACHSTKEAHMRHLAGHMVYGAGSMGSS